MEIKETKELQSERILLRKLKISDVNSMYNNWTSDKAIDRFVSWNLHKEKIDTEKLLDFWINKYEEEYTYRWGIVLKGKNELIGCIDVIDSSIKNKTCEIGYCIGSKWWNQGYTTEALKLVINFLFEAGFEVITAQHIESNPASGKVMKKAGMIYEGTLHSRIINKSGQKENLKVYYLEKK